MINPVTSKILKKIEEDDSSVVIVVFVLHTTTPTTNQLNKRTVDKLFSMLAHIIGVR